MIHILLGLNVTFIDFLIAVTEKEIHRNRKFLPGESVANPAHR